MNLRALLLVPLVCTAFSRAAFGIITINSDSLSLSLPSNGAPWGYVARLDNEFGARASGVYLGNRYILTANHVDNDIGLIHLDNADFTLDSSFTPMAIQGTDMRLLRLAEDPGLPMLPLINSSQSAFSKAATMIGWGVGKGTVVPNQGWNWADDTTRLERWGTSTTLGSYFTDPASGITYLVTTFNNSAGAQTGQLTAGDSGGGLFINFGGVWTLAGINASVDTNNQALYDNNLLTAGNQPDRSYFASLTQFTSQIQTLIGGVPIGGLVQYWDGAGQVANGVIDGSAGNWNTTLTNWTNSAGSINTKWQGGTAIFSGTGGTITLTSAISAQALTFNSSGYVVAGASALTLAGTAPEIDVTNASDVATISAPIAGTKGLKVGGAGTLIVTNPGNSYTGATVINAGKLQIGTTTAYSRISASPVTLGQGGTLSLVYVYGNALANSVSTGTGGGTLNIAAFNTMTLSGALTDDGTNALALSQSGSGTTILTNAHNTYSGLTTISASTLQVGTAVTAGSIGANSPVSLLNNSTLALLNVSGGTLANNIDHASLGSGLVNVNASSSTTLSGTITNSNGLLALAKNGTGTLVISNFGNSYSGGTTLNTGTLIANGSLGNGTLTIKGGTLGTTLSTGIALYNPISLLGNFSLATNSNPSNPGSQNFVLNGNIDLNGATRTITGTTNMGQPQFGGSIGVPGETAGLNFNTPFTAAGSYVAFILNPSNVNNYTGLTTVNNGAILIFEGATANSAIRGNLNITGNGVVDYIIGSGSAEQIADTSTVTVNSSGNTVSGLHFDGLELRGANEAIGTLNGTGKVGLGSGALGVGAGTFSGIIEDGAFGVGGSLIKNTAGTLILSGKNTYTGYTVVSAGTLQAGAVNIIPSGSPLAVAAGGTFKLNNFAQSVASLTGNGNISLGSGTLTVGSSNTNAGFSGAISGTGGLTKVGTGIFGLNGTNTYTGPTTLTRGMLLITPTSTVPVLSSSSRLVVGGTAATDGGTFVLYGVANTPTSQILNGLTINAGSSLIAVDNVGTTTTLDLRGPLGTLGIIRNANGFVDFQAVDGTLGVDAIIKTHQANNASGILGGWATVNGGTGYAANNGSDVIVAYTGYADIAATADTVPNNANRNVRINSAGTGGSDVVAAHPLTSINTLTQNSTTASTIALAGGTLKLGTDGGILITPDSAGLTIGAAPRDGVLAAVGTATISLSNFSANGPLTINSSITNAGGGAISVRFTGGGTTVFAGANAYTGSTAILSGVLRTDAVNTIPSASAVTLNSIATLDLNSNSQTVASINDGPNGGGNIALGSATLTLGSTNANSVVSGVISGTNGSLVKAGTGSLTLSGANTYSGGTTLNSGTLIANGSLGTGPLTIKGGTLGTTLSTGNTLYNPISLLGNFSLATNSNPSSPGSQNFVLNGNIDLGGATRTITGTTNMGQPQFGGSIGVPGETAGLNFNTSFTAAGSYVAFILNPSNVNNYTGLTTVNNGAILVFEGATANGAIRGNLNITGNGVVDYIMGNTAPEQIADTATVTVNSAGNTASGSHFDGLELRGAYETIGALNGIGKVGLGSGRLTVGSGTFSGVIEDGAFGTGGSLVKNTAGTLILSGLNTYTGYTAVVAGTLQTNAVNTLPNKSMVGVGSGATLDLHNFSQSVGSIVNVNGTGGIIKLGTAVLTTGSDGQNAIFSGVIQDSGRLVKVGSGGLNLTGANTYTGGTTINAGVLLANNSTGSATGSGAVTINSGATLGGGGTVGAVTLNNGGIVSPGVATPGTAGTTLHATSMMWNGGGTLKLQLGAPGDELVLTGALTKGTAGTYAINIVDAGITQTTYTLATFASTTFAPTNFTLTLPAGDTGNLTLTSTSLLLEITSVAPASPGQQPASPDYGGTLTITGSGGGSPTQTVDSGELSTGDSGVTVTALTLSGGTSSLTLSGGGSTIGESSNLTLTPTPEPGGVALLCVGAISLLGGRRRRQR